MSKVQKFSVYSFLFINLIIILLGWWFGTGYYAKLTEPSVFLAMARISGLLAVFFVLGQFLLIGREVWLEKLFGLDNLARVHRWNGFLSFGLILAHLVFVTFAYAAGRNISWLNQFLNFFSSNELLQAIIAVLFFLIVSVSSMVIARRKLKYENWYYVHLITYLAVLLAWGHQLKLGGDFINGWFVAYWYFLYIFVLLNFVYFRFIRPVVNFYRFNFVVDDLVQETEHSWSVYIKALKGNLNDLRIKPGQFMNFRFLNKQGWWQSHPFSLSNIPKNNRFRITIKVAGDFTAQIANLKKGTKVLIEGPFGLFTALPGSHHHYLFLAGGVGISSIRALVEQVAPANDVVVLFSNRSLAEIIFKKEMDDLAKQYQFKLVYLLTDKPVTGYESGRIDQQKLQALVQDIQTRQVYLCGPPAMMDHLTNVLKTCCGLRSEQIHFDKFSLT